jgi:alanine racemase
MFRPTRTLIHLDRLVHNARVLRTWAGADAFFCPMIKAQAYGHGAGEVALALEKAGFDQVGVALVEEAIHLRQAGYRNRIFVFGPLDGESKSAVEDFHFIPVISRWSDLAMFKTSNIKELHVKFNTGMNRLGFAAEDASRVSEFAKTMQPKLTGVCTHMSNGSDALQVQGFTQRQLRIFSEIAINFPGVQRHCLNSSALLALQNMNESERAQLGSRPGISLYGLPSGYETVPEELKPVLEWKTQIDIVQNVKKGEAVSYSARWTAPKDSVIGIVPMGYADGYFRSLTNQGVMLFRGQRVNVVGTVCMDYTLLDLTEVAGAKPPQPSEEVVAIGEQGGEKILAAELAKKLNTVSYEIATNISARVPRIFMGAK